MTLKYFNFYMRFGCKELIRQYKSYQNNLKRQTNTLENFCRFS